MQFGAAMATILWYHTAMQLLQPLFLAALALLPLIALLHIIRERRRRVAVPSLILWRNLPQKPEGRRISRLPLSLLLLLHLLIAALLAFALARPQLNAVLGGTPGHSILIVDTSTSMGAAAGAATRLAGAQAEARDVVRAMRGDDRVTLIAMGPRARLVDAGGPGDIVRLLQSIDGLQAGGTGSNLAEALTLAQAALEADRDAQIVVLSDGALPALPGALDLRPVAAPVEWRGVGSAIDNRAIVTFAARPWAGEQRVQVFARIANFSDRPELLTLRLYLDGRPLDERQVALDANGQSEQTWSLDAPNGRLEARLGGGDALPADDAAALQLGPRRTIRTVLVSEEPEVLQRALAALPEIDLPAERVIAPAQYNPLPADLTIFDGYLPAGELPPGGVLLIAPPTGSGIVQVERPASLPANDLHTQGPLLQGLSLGGVDFGPVMRLREVPPWADVLLASGETPLVLRGRSGQSELTVWTFGLRQGNLRARLAFPLLVARTVRDLSPPPLPATLAAGADLELRPSPRAEQVVLRAPDGSEQRRAAEPLLTFQTLSQPGIYTLREERAGETLFEGAVAVNAGSSAESELRPGQQPEIPELPSVSVAGSAQAEGRDLWPWLAGMALAVLLFEWLYIQRRPLGRNA